MTVGSEMSSGVRNVLVKDCNFGQSLIGLWIKSAPERGGYVRNVEFRRIPAGMLRLHGLSGRERQAEDGRRARFRAVHQEASTNSDGIRQKSKGFPGLTQVGKQATQSKSPTLHCRRWSAKPHNQKAPHCTDADGAKNRIMKIRTIETIRKKGSALH